MRGEQEKIFRVVPPYFRESLKSFDNNLALKILGLLEILDELGVHLGPPKLKKINKEIDRNSSLSQKIISIKELIYRT